MNKPDQDTSSDMELRRKTRTLKETEIPQVPLSKGTPDISVLNLVSEDFEGVNYTLDYNQIDGNFSVNVKGATENPKKLKRKLKNAINESLFPILSMGSFLYNTVGEEQYGTSTPTIERNFQVYSSNSDAIAEIETEFMESIQELVSKSPKEHLKTPKKDMLLYGVILGGALAGTAVSLAVPVVVAAGLGASKIASDLYKDISPAIENLKNAAGVIPDMAVVRDLTSSIQASAGQVYTILQDSASEVELIVAASTAINGYAESIGAGLSGAYTSLDGIKATASQILNETTGDLTQIKTYLDSATAGLDTVIAGLTSTLDDVNQIITDADARATELGNKITGLSGPTGGTTYTWSDGTSTTQVSADYDNDGVVDVIDNGDGTYTYDADSGNPAIFYHQAVQGGSSNYEAKNISAMFEANTNTYQTYQADKSAFEGISANAGSIHTNLSNYITDLETSKSDINAVSGDGELLDGLGDKVQSMSDSATEAQGYLDTAQTDLDGVYTELGKIDTSTGNLDVYLNGDGENLGAIAQTQSIQNDAGVVYTDLDGVDTLAAGESLNNASEPSGGVLRKLAGIPGAVMYIPGVATAAGAAVYVFGLRKRSTERRKMRKSISDFAQYQSPIAQLA